METRNVSPIATSLMMRGPLDRGQDPGRWPTLPEPLPQVVEDAEDA